MKEIEVKVIEIDKKKIIKKLKELKAKKIGEYNIEAMLFDTSNKKFSKKKNLIRLRKKNDCCYFTFKGKETRGFARKAEEIEFIVSDFEKSKLFLEKIGLIPYSFTKKHRITFELKNALIEIDEYSNIPVFLEIEAKSEKKIREIISLLGLSSKNIKTWNSFDLFKYYKKKYSF
ncbi:MAG: class IV adenylate cyclase [Candidatus ainarchaeum sp.]|nr:class IV adenylate cyclase [Candidatus ainarchaeum sp.]